MQWPWPRPDQGLCNGFIRNKSVKWVHWPSFTHNSEFMVWLEIFSLGKLPPIGRRHKYWELPPPELKIYNSITRKEKLICDLSECGWVIFTIITCPNSKKNLVYILDFLDFFSNFLQPAHKSLQLQCFAAEAAQESQIFSPLLDGNI